MVSMKKGFWGDRITDGLVGRDNFGEHLTNYDAWVIVDLVESYYVISVTLYPVDGASSMRDGLANFKLGKLQPNISPNIDYDFLEDDFEVWYQHKGQVTKNVILDFSGSGRIARFLCVRQSDAVMSIKRMYISEIEVFGEDFNEALATLAKQCNNYFSEMYENDYIGCQLTFEPTDNPTRTDSIKSCFEFCSKSKAKLFALTKGFECTCGEKSGKSISSTHCDIFCPNMAGFCGGKLTYSVYKISDKVEQAVTHYVGCYTDETNTEVMGPPISKSSRLDNEMCRDLCNKSYFATQAGKYCYCSDVYDSLGSAWNCDMHCPSVPIQLCGGINANQVYKDCASHRCKFRCQSDHIGSINFGTCLAYPGEYVDEDGGRQIIPISMPYGVRVNAAYSKPTYFSLNYNSPKLSTATDGLIKLANYLKSINPNRNSQEWFAVDLIDDYTVNFVVIFNEICLDKCLGKFEIKLSNHFHPVRPNFEKMYVCGRWLLQVGSSGVSMKVKCIRQFIEYRFVIVKLVDDSKGSLGFAEIEVYTKELAPVYMGCYNGIISSVVGSPKINSFSLCNEFCSSNKLPFMAIRQGTKCYCTAVYGLKLPSSMCKAACRDADLGDDTPCGGSTSFAIYAVRHVNNYDISYIGCYQKSAEVHFIVLKLTLKDCLSYFTFKYTFLNETLAHCADGPEHKNNLCLTDECMNGWTGPFCNRRGDCSAKDGRCPIGLKCKSYQVKNRLIGECVCDSGYVLDDSRCLHTSECKSSDFCKRNVEKCLCFSILESSNGNLHKIWSFPPVFLITYFAVTVFFSF
ncbi:hypothetical protein HELRODRAFT_176375 [Helobdella robusta]|uniref:WSC domain-containing protein n=1 Tax=Helobdella robusta TaxID=6412 RepID=T1FAG4_HELRO|nr:hypothetical protein HELRODRAFT_176375 [Helobdella robusta]ESO00065.1 hypothetical protein HELRODRAFT_176375 [Helobdella robusta]